MTNILIHGCHGAMGTTLADAAQHTENVNLVAGVDRNPCYFEFPTFTDIEDFKGHVDVIVDFSNPQAFGSLLDYAVKTNTAVLFATTGLSEEQHAKMHVAAEKIPVFFSANMSVAVNLLIATAKRFTMALQNQCDIEIIEKHHNRKVDAPSGTALAIADAIKSVKTDAEFVYERASSHEKRKPTEVGIHSIRGGSMVGEHTVIFAGASEIIELKHTVESRRVFAEGALTAAQYLAKQGPGFYNMERMLGGEHD